MNSAVELIRFSGKTKFHTLDLQLYDLKDEKKMAVSVSIKDIMFRKLPSSNIREKPNIAERFYGWYRHCGVIDSVETTKTVSLESLISCLLSSNIQNPSNESQQWFSLFIGRLRIPLNPKSNKMKREDVYYAYLNFPIPACDQVYLQLSKKSIGSGDYIDKHLRYYEFEESHKTQISLQNGASFFDAVSGTMLPGNSGFMRTFPQRTKNLNFAKFVHWWTVAHFIQNIVPLASQRDSIPTGILLSKRTWELLQTTIQESEKLMNPTVFRPKLTTKFHVKPGSNRKMLIEDSDVGTTYSNFLPYDPEADLINAGPSCSAFRKAISIHHLASCVNMLPDDLILRGVLASWLQSNLQFRMLLPNASLPSSVRSFGSTTLDIDQVSLELIRLNKHVIDHACRHHFVFNVSFLEYHYKHLLRQVFNDKLPTEIILLNLARFCSKLHSKGGHSYMSDSKRCEYTKINECEYNGNSIRIGLRILPHLKADQTRKTTSFHYAFFDDTERALLRGYSSFQPTKKMFTAILLTAKYLNTAAGNEQSRSLNHRLAVFGWNAATGNNAFQCCGGIMLHLLASLQLVLLEEWVRCTHLELCGSVAMSIETFGGKSRYSVPLNPYDDTPETRDIKLERLCRELTPSPEMPASVIALFSSYIAKELRFNNPRSHHFYWGIGVSISGMLLDGKPLYATVSYDKLALFLAGIKPSTASVDGADADEESDEDDWEEADDKSAWNVREMVFPTNQRKTFTIHGTKPHAWTVQFYPTWGGWLPMYYQPYLAKLARHAQCLSHQNTSCLVRIQHYSIQARAALGEYLRVSEQRLTVTEEAAECYKYLSIATYVNKTSGEIHREYRYGHHKQKLNNAMDALKCNCRLLRELGNAARLEIAFKSTYFEDQFLALRYPIDTLLKLLEQCLEYYDIIPDLTTLMEFSCNGLRQRSDLAARQLNGQKVTSHHIHDMFAAITEECGSWRRFYNGRYDMWANATICHKFILLTGRPIFAITSPSLNEQMVRIVPGCMPIYNQLLSSLDLRDAPLVNIVRTPFLKVSGVRQIDGMVCRHCGWLYDSQETFMLHPCIVKPTLEDDCVSIVSVDAARLREQEYKKLGSHQQHFVDCVINSPINVYLTGGAGCGKTKTLLCAIAYLRAKFGVSSVAALCFTKSAANEIHGITIHSFLGLSNDVIELSNTDTIIEGLLHGNAYKLQRIAQTEVLIIDEISLVNGIVFDYLDIVLRRIKRHVNMGEYNTFAEAPFGGAQVILCGDVLQLPPLCEVDYYNLQGHKVTNLKYHFFLSQAFVKSHFWVYYLHYIYRQTDVQQQTMLNLIRDGNVQPHHIELLNNLCGTMASREVIEFLCNMTQTLNKADACATTQRTKDAFYKKVKYFIIANRCGVFNKHGIYSNEGLTSNELAKEFDQRPFGANINREMSLLERFANHFIIGVENAEEQPINDALEIMGSQLGVMMEEDLYFHDAIDTYYEYTKHQRDDPVVDQIKDRLRRSEDVIYEGHIDVKATSPFVFADTRNRSKRLAVHINQTVVFCSNFISPLVANNSTGVVRHIEYDIRGKLLWISVEPLGKTELYHPSIKVVPDRVCVSCEVVANTNNVYRLVYREQFPIKPACWATGYSVEGMTIDKFCLVFNNIRNTNSNCGLFYMLISRVCNLQQFCTVRPIVMNDIKCDMTALRFDKRHRGTNANRNYTFERVTYDRQYVEDHFIYGKEETLTNQGSSVRPKRNLDLVI